MMHKKLISLVLLLASAAGVAMAQDGHRYGIKSGILTQKSEMDETTVYFDNYGALEAQKMKMNFMGMDTEMTIIRKDGKTYMVNAAEKQVQEMPAGGGMGGADINFLNLTDAVPDGHGDEPDGLDLQGHRPEVPHRRRPVPVRQRGCQVRGERPGSRQCF